eukprot:s444_g39.t1
MVDSAALFKSRCQATGLSDAAIATLTGKGWGTLGTFAFCASNSPATMTDAVFIEKVVVPVLGDRDHVDASKLRRLHFEAYTTVSAELKRRVESSEQDAPRKLPPQEISERLESLQKKITPLKIENALEPSHSLINHVAQFVEEGRLRYIDWSKCTTRTQEVNNLKEDQFLKVWKPDASGVIKAVDKGLDVRAAVSTDLEVHNALRRRGVAYDVGQAMSFESHEALINLFFNEMQREPLEGFQRVTLEQVAAADREVHVRLAEKTRAGLTKSVEGALPLDKPLKEVMESSEVRWLLMPMPKRLQPRAEPPKKKAEEDTKAAPKVSPKKVAQPKANANGPRKARKGPMPAGLRGGVPVNSDGKPICFGYNLGTCKSDGDCPKGKGAEKCADATTAMGEGPLMSCERAASKPKGSFSFAPSSMDDMGASHVPSLPQAADVGAPSGDGPNLFASSSTMSQTTPVDRGKPYFLDIFCGTAGVTASLKRLGAEAIGIDHVLHKARMKAPAVKLDLTLPSSQQMVEDEIRSGRVSGVMLAPPCGTFSKARNIPLRDRNGRKMRGPPPLRSHQYPQGIPGLTGVNRTRVKQANKLYAFCRRIMELCEELNILCIVENPESSLFWATVYMSPPPPSFQWHVVHACMYGSKRLKKTGLLINFSAPNLRQTCDGNHQHLPWSHTTTMDPLTNRKKQVFDTASEAEYPRQFCDALAAAFVLELQCRGFSWNMTPAPHESAAHLANDKQPRGLRSPVVVSEFKHTVQLSVPLNTELPEVVGAESSFPFEGLPIGARLVSFQHFKQEGSQDALKTAVYGIYRTPEEFLEEALQLRHPFNIPVSTDSDNIQALAGILKLGKLGVMKFRLEQVQKYRKLADTLAHEEQELHNSMQPDVARIMNSKRLLLFKRMMEDAGIEDASLLDELREGFRLTGQLEASGLFRPRFKPADMTVAELRNTSKWARHAIVGSCKRVAENKEVAEAVWEETCNQLQAGWIKGPYTAEELNAKFPKGWIPSKRFGVVQGNKVRAVDDFSEFLVNSACGTSEQILLQGLDDVASAAKYMLSASSGDRGIWLPSDEGLHVYHGQVDESWTEDELRDLKGRALDLKSAYKQLARSSEDDWCSILAVWSPEERDVRFFESVALPFGAVSAVNAFNRVAKCLRIILCRLFLLVNTSFFDDYCQLEFAPLCDSAWKTAETVLKLLGWQVAMSEEKRRPFDKRFNMLGAVVDLTASAEGLVKVSNKDSRIEELRATAEGLSIGGVFSEAQLQSLRGRLLYAAGHTFGKCTQVAVQALGRVAKKGTSFSIDDELLQCIHFAINTLASSEPRLVRAWKDEWPVIIFTDGACEENAEKVTHGAVLCDVTSNSFFFFGDDVPAKYVADWTKGGKKQVICQAELFPIWVAKVTWKDILRGRQVLWFCDNEAARAAMIRSYSPLLDSMQIVRNCAWEDVSAQTLNWYARVPSKSNLSDDASRLAFGRYRTLGFAKVQPVNAHDKL